MAEKRTVNNIASVGIIYRESDPRQIFIDIKDGGYPIKAFRWMHCPIGGNWIGESARYDLNPQHTFFRELAEELLLKKQKTSTQEMNLLGFTPDLDTYVVPKKDVAPTAEDYETLVRLKMAFVKAAEPFGNFLVTVPKSVLDRNVPDNTRPGYSSLFPYWLVPVKKKEWTMLTALHEKFGNLSVESIAVITTLDEIIATNRYTCCGHDRVMQEFFIQMGLPNAEKYPLLDGISCEKMGMPFNSYKDYTEHYIILRTPFTT